MLATGRSAYGAASMRAMEAFVPEAQRLFEDQIVLDLLPPSIRFLLRKAPIRAAFRSLLEATAPGVRGALLCRTRRIDDAVRDAVRGGLRAVVILGAGLDTRPYRLIELAECNVVEIDLPAVQELKKACLLRRFGTLPSRVRFVPMDLNAMRLDTTFEGAGLKTSEPVIFICEGVSQYLQPHAVESILRMIAGKAAGTVLAFTYVLEEVVTGVHRSERSEVFRKSARRRPEPWYFGIDPRRLRSFLRDRGLRLVNDFGTQEHKADYLLPVTRRMEVSEIERVAIATV